jgi:hypothetical protein
MQTQLVSTLKRQTNPFFKEKKALVPSDEYEIRKKTL